MSAKTNTLFGDRFSSYIGNCEFDLHYHLPFSSSIHGQRQQCLVFGMASGSRLVTQKWRVPHAESRMRSFVDMTSDDRPMKQTVIQPNASFSLKKSRVAELGANRDLCTTSTRRNSMNTNSIIVCIGTGTVPGTALPPSSHITLPSKHTGAVSHRTTHWA